MTRVERDDERLWITASYQDRLRASGLPGARWQPERRCWSVPATPLVARLVMAAFPDAAGAPPLVELAALRSRQDAMGAERDRADWPDDYPWQTRPWAHQRGATRWASVSPAALLHCHMGTGKTKITLDAVRARGHRTVLVACPLGVMPVWASEVQKHQTGAFDVLALGRGTVARRAAVLVAALGSPRERALIVLVNYDAMWRGALGAAVLGHRWDCLVLDESQRIKSPGAKCSQFAARIPAGHRLALTGTPMPHSPLDVYGQYRALDPGVFGTRFSAFRDRYAVMGGYQNHQVVAFRNQDELRERMDLLRWRVAEDALDLPELQVIDRECELEPEARTTYKALSDDFVAEVRGGTVTVANALVKLLRLAQMTSGYAVLDREPLDGEDRLPAEAARVSTAKADLLAEMLEDLAGERVVVFARFVRDLDDALRIGAGLGYATYEISGRRKDYEAWKAHGSGSALMAVQIRAGSLGIDLTEARYGIFYSLGYSLGDYDQAIARMHRPGQHRPVVVYRLLASTTVDGAIARALDKRRDVVESILQEARDGNALAGLCE